MKAVVWGLPADIESWRATLGADRREEMWEGTLHVGPPPSVEHQQVEIKLGAWLIRHWVPKTGGMASTHVAVAHPEWVPDRWTKNYRAPDLVLLLPERFAINRDDYLCGGPDVVIEIRSPGDESCNYKLGFYGEVGVREAWIIGRDTKACEIHVATGRGTLEPIDSDAGGWLRSAAAGVALRRTRANRLAIRCTDDPATETLIP